MSIDFPDKAVRPVMDNAELVPQFLDERDVPWLRALIDVYLQYGGRRRSDLDERLCEPLPVPSPKAKRVRAIAVMDRLCREQTRASVDPRKVRAALFMEAAQGGSREAVLRRAGAQLKVKPQTLLECLFADLPGQRRVSAPPSDLNPWQLALRVNLALAQGLLARSSSVSVDLWGNARDVVRYARLRGLICTVRHSRSPLASGTVLDISGPYALFRRTLVYGRALASLVPRLSWCDRFDLRAQCVFASESRMVVLRSGDPIFPSKEPRRFDSKLEARFARDFARAAPDWDLVREPQPVVARDTLIFPDFGIVHRRHANRRWLLEIVGYWTPQYLRDKLRRLNAAELRNIIVCVDEERNCATDRLPSSLIVVPYRRRIKPQDILNIIEPV